VKEVGRREVLAIVVAFDDPNLPAELEEFDGATAVGKINGLPHSTPCTVAWGPHPCLEQVAFAGEKQFNPTWAREQAADVEWAHAMAPQADILVVEAVSAAINDLIGAAEFAVTRGSAVVSMSWGVPESSDLVRRDSTFDRPGVVFVAASGDKGHGVNYPATSPNVLAVGGTVLTSRVGSVVDETAWWGSGGGISSLEPRPAYQGTRDSGIGRAVPDVAYAAEPGPGFPVYVLGTTKGWIDASGTSIGAVQWAALAALMDEHLGGHLSSRSLLARLYALAADPLAYARSFHDVSAGLNGACGADCAARRGFDLVTGLGSPLVPGLLQSL
jgi:subtilase family serine protease